MRRAAVTLGRLLAGLLVAGGTTATDGLIALQGAVADGDLHCPYPCAAQ